MCSSSSNWDLIPILHASHQVVLYNPTSHAISIRERAASELHPLVCPYCERPYGTDADDGHQRDRAEGHESRADNYFQLLAVANESSRPSSPFLRTPPLESGSDTETSRIRSLAMAEGYFSAFFKEECRLGMGANGSVFLCQHVLDGNFLGRFAVKKIAVGQSHDYLLKSLREVRLLETLRHPNIINYHHAWLETCRFSSFGPSVPTLFVLMQWAEGGSLQDFICARLGTPSHLHNHSASSSGDDEPRSRSARIRAFRAAQAHPEIRRRDWRNGRAVHLLSAEEVKDMFDDVVSGLGFLHARSILHLDLKPGNVLLTWDDGGLIPRAMLSDFGTYQDMVRPQHERTGITGTLEYTAPESLSLSNEPSSKADMWSLGMILHMMLFFRLPYDHVEDSDISKLEEEVRMYPGFKSTSETLAACRRRGLPRAALILLEELLAVAPFARPSCEQILAVLKEGKLDPLREHASDEDRVSLVPVARSRRDSVPHHSSPTAVVAVDKSIHDRELRYSSVDVDDEPDSDLNASTVANAFLKNKGSQSSLTTPIEPAPPLPSPSRSPSRSTFVALKRALRPLQTRAQSWFPLFPASSLSLSTHRLSAARLIKSALLVSKVVSLTNLCTPTSPRMSITLLVLTLAVVDTWHDNAAVSFFLGLCHLGILASGKRHCCMY